MSASGAFARIPLLAGNADHEDGWYRIAGWGAKLNFTNAQWDLFTQRAFTCPSAYSTKYRVQYKVLTWRYRYHGDWDNLRLYNSSAGLGPRGSAAYHGSDLNMVFGTAEDVSGLDNTPAEDATIRYIQGAWAAFARDSKSGLTKYGWPAYNENGKYLDGKTYDRHVANGHLQAQLLCNWRITIAQSRNLSIQLFTTRRVLRRTIRCLDEVPSRKNRLFSCIRSLNSQCMRTLVQYKQIHQCQPLCIDFIGLFFSHISATLRTNVTPPIQHIVTSRPSLSGPAHETGRTIRYS